MNFTGYARSSIWICDSNDPLHLLLGGARLILLNYDKHSKRSLIAPLIAV